MIRALLPAALAGLLLGGCASTIPVPTTVETAGMPNPENALRQSMQHVDAEMSQLGQFSPRGDRAVGPLVPEDLQRTVSFNWSGPLDKGVAKLAASIGYTFFTTGPAGAQEVPVAVQIQSVPVLQVFQTLGEQAGANATVEVDPIHHSVQVIHHV
jgi:defect-in-organelle-trafficking protein DotD